MNRQKTECYAFENEKKQLVGCADYLRELVGNRQVVFVCIGTDRSTGDALGPIVGTDLKEHGYKYVHGTLDYPVHATNLVETMDLVRRSYNDPFIIAVDACLAEHADTVGRMTVGNGPMRPGAGVGKTLPPVGNVYVTGMVNVGGFMEYFVLQNTRLSAVMRLAKMITSVIKAAYPLATEQVAANEHR